MTTTPTGGTAGIPTPHTAADETPGTARGPLPCVARPHAGLVHRDGACRCFTGGPAPEHAGRPEDALLGLAFHGAV